MSKFGERESLSSNALIVCEGKSDEAFFHALIKERKLPNFCVRITGDAGKGHGNEHFGDFLESVVGWSQFHLIKNIVIVSDNDANPSRGFKMICDQIETADPEIDPPVVFKAPNKACKTAAGRPSMTVLMLPWRGKRGCLETLCLEAAIDAGGKSSDIAKCALKFADCSGASGWPQSKNSKMMLQAMLSSQNKGNPAISLSNVWRDKTGLIPLDHACFDELCEFLAKFEVEELPALPAR